MKALFGQRMGSMMAPSFKKMGSAPTPSDFPYVFDGITPVLDLEYNDESGNPVNQFLMNGVTYNTLAAFIAAGGSNVGAAATPIDVTPWWNPPHTIRMTGIAPTAYNASGVNTAFLIFDGNLTNNNFVLLRFISAAPGTQFSIRRLSATPVADLRYTQDALGGLYGAGCLVAVNDARYSSRMRITLKDNTVPVLPTLTQLILGSTGVAGQEWNGRFDRFTIW